MEILFRFYFRFLVAGFWREIWIPVVILGVVLVQPTTLSGGFLILCVLI